jgi:DNA-binding XRE family transcriptional regulator
MKADYIERMLKNLPALRASIGLTQEQLGKKLGMSRQTIVAIETRKRPLPWDLYLAMVCVFQQYEESQILLNSFELFNGEFVREKL